MNSLIINKSNKNKPDLLLLPGHVTSICGLSACVLILIISALYSANTQSQEIAKLDWVSKEQLSDEQLALCPENCSGAYITPERTDPDANATPESSEIRGEADSTLINMDTEEITLEGNVIFTQGWREVRGEKVEIDRIKGRVALEGDVSIREPGILLIGDHANMEAETGMLTVENAQYVFAEQHIRGSAASISRTPLDGISIDEASYTSCEPGDDAWVLYAKEIDINENTGRAVAKGVSIEAAGIPIFYAPIFSFVTDDRRLSGLLYPEISNSTIDGLSYSQPFYINLAENQDLTLTPRFTSKRGSGLDAEYRLLTKNSFSSIAGAYFPSDDVNPDHSGSRWLANIKHRGQYDDDAWTTNVDFSDVSDDDVLEDWNTRVFNSNSQDLYLKQHASIGYHSINWRYQLSATSYTSLVDSDTLLYRELPKLTATGQYRLNNGIQIQLNNELVNFDHESDSINTGANGFQLGEDNTWITGKRLRMGINAHYKKEWGSAYFQPSAGLQYLTYQLDSSIQPLQGSPTNSDSPSSIAPELGFDSGVTFERSSSFFGGQQRQTLEPRLSYIYRDADKQNDQPVFDTAYASRNLEQLFSVNDYIGGDRLEDQNRVTIGLWTRFYNAADDRELLSFGIGQRFYLEDRQSHINNALLEVQTQSTVSNVIQQAANNQLNELARNQSEIVAELNWFASEAFSAKSSIFWDEKESDITRVSIALQYENIETDTKMQLSYELEDALFAQNQLFFGETSSLISNTLVEQISAQAELALNDKWSLAALWSRDLKRNRDLDKAIGLSYQSCCWNISLGWHTQLQRNDTDDALTNNAFSASEFRTDRGLLLSFELIGLGGVGTSASSLLAN